MADIIEIGTTPDDSPLKERQEKLNRVVPYDPYHDNKDGEK